MRLKTALITAILVPVVIGGFVYPLLSNVSAREHNNNYAIGVPLKVEPQEYDLPIAIPEDGLLSQVSADTPVVEPAGQEPEVSQAGAPSDKLEATSQKERREKKEKEDKARKERPESPKPKKIKSKLPPSVTIYGPEDSQVSQVIVPYQNAVIERIDPILSEVTTLINEEYIREDNTVDVIVEIADWTANDLNKAEKDISSILKRLPNSKVKKQFKNAKALHATIDLAYLDNLALDPDVKKVWLDRRVFTTLDKSIPLVNADDVWNLVDPQGNLVKGQGVTVAVIDTGVDYTHEDLGGCTVSQFTGGTCTKVPKGYDFINNDSNPMDDHGHGTHVAATVGGTGGASGGVYKGVAPEVTIWGVKVLNSAGSGAWSQVISGIDWATDPNNDGDFSDGADIMSLSLGGGCSPCDGTDIVSQAIDRALERGVLPVVAAGNSGPSDQTVGTPGVARGALTVGASNDTDQIASFSSRGPTSDFRIKPDITAPGVAICAAQWGSYANSSKCGTKHISISGTSMATPHVSGAAALIKQLHPSWSPQEIKSALILSAKDISLPSTYQGSGRMDVLKASAAPFTLDKTSVSFGNLGASGIGTQSITITNKSDSPITISINPEEATRKENSTKHSVVTSSSSSVTIPANSSANVDLVMDLTGKDGTFYGNIRLTESGRNYRLAYYGVRVSVISFVVKNEDGSIANSNAMLFNAVNASHVASSLNGYQHNFVVAPGEYFLIGSKLTNFYVKSNPSQINRGEDKSVEISLSQAITHRFKAYDINGEHYFRTQSGEKIGVVRLSDGQFYRSESYVIGGALDKTDLSIKLYNLDMSGSSVAKTSLAISATGSYEKECEFGRTFYCTAAINIAPVVYYAGFKLENPRNTPNEHIWDARTDSIGPKEMSVNTIFDYKDPTYKSIWRWEFFGDARSVERFGSVEQLNKYFGTKQDVYYPRELNTWALETWTALGPKNGVFSVGKPAYNNGVYNDFKIDPALIGDALFGAKPLKLGKLYTDREYLESDNEWVRSGQTYMDDRYPYAPLVFPVITVYKNGLQTAKSSTVVGQTGSLLWDRSVHGGGPYSFKYKPQDPGNYRVNVDLPDIGAGHITQNYYFSIPSQSRSTPHIASIKYPPYFLPDRKFRVFIIPKSINPVSDVRFEYKQGEEWVQIQSRQVEVESESIYAASLTPLDYADLAVRITITDNIGNAVEYTYEPLVKRGISLNVSADFGGVLCRYGDKCYDKHVKSISCVDNSGGQCPNIALELYCGDQKLRDWYYRSYNTSAIPHNQLLFDCSGEPAFYFVGSGSYFDPEYDFSSPTGIISINNGARYTNSTSVILSLLCADYGSDCSTMQFSNDGVTYSALEPVFAAKDWTLASGTDGLRTVYVKYIDLAGNISESFSDTITLDTTSPTGSISVNNGAQYANTTSVTLTIPCTDSLSGCSRVHISNDGDSYLPQPYAPAIEWNLIPGEGAKTVYVKFEDGAGNTSESFRDSITLDMFAPMGTISINNGSQYSRSQSATLNLLCTDTLFGCSEMQFSNDGSAYSAPEPYSAAKSWTLSPGDGEKTVYAKFKDVSGNFSTAVSDTIILDSTPPTGTISINSGDEYTRVAQATLTLSCSDVLSGCYEMQFSNDGTTYSAREPYRDSKLWTLPQEGVRTIYAIYWDAAGNAETVADSITFDSTPPQGTISINSGASYTNTTLVTLTLSCADATSGCDKMQFSNDGATYSQPEPFAASRSWQLAESPDGERTVRVRYIDRAGNTTLKSDLIVLDTVRPSGTISINAGVAFTNTASVILTLSCTDITSGCDKMQFSNDGAVYSALESYSTAKSWTLLSADGLKKVYVKYTDKAGNVSAQQVDEITLDATVPTGSVSINAGAEYTNHTSVTLTLSCSDALSGCDKMQFSNDGATYSAKEQYKTAKMWTLSDPGDGIFTKVYTKFIDVAGNTSAVYQDDIILDRVSPTINSMRPKTYTNYTNDLETVSLLQKPVISGDFTIKAKASDDRKFTSLEFLIDNKAVFTQTQPQNNLEYSWKWTTEDQLSNYRLGDHTIKVIAKDSAGNVKTQEVVVTVVAAP